jgi:acetyl esterase/lipase
MTLPPRFLRSVLFSILLVFLLCPALPSAASDGADPVVYKTETDISYLEGNAAEKADDYQRSQCRMDLYFPTNRPGFATVIWLHGGGLTGGKRSWPLLQDKGIAIVSPSYRLSPKAGYDDILDDAATVTAWTLQHIAERGGDPTKVFLAGHSAGGYLAAMVGMDPRWLAAKGLSHLQLAGIIPVSAQVTTHFEVKKLRGDTKPEFRPIIDEYAPLYWASKDLPPILLVTGDRHIEYKNRVEENNLLAVSLRNLGHPAVEFYEMGGLDHGGSRLGAWVLMPNFINKIIKERGGVTPR